MLSKTQNKQKGFTLIELMIVIAIIGILAAIAVPNFLRYRLQSCNTSAHSDVRNAYMMAQNFFINQPDKEVTTDDLSKLGYVKNTAVVINILDGKQVSLSISGKHNSGDRTFTVDHKGDITSL